MAIAQNELHTLLALAFPNADITLDDLRGDQDHYRLVIKDESFNGQTKIKQHQMVYKALGSIMGNELHALMLETHPKTQDI